MINHEADKPQSEQQWQDFLKDRLPVLPLRPERMPYQDALKLIRGTDPEALPPAEQEHELKTLLILQHQHPPLYTVPWSPFLERISELLGRGVSLAEVLSTPDELVAELHNSGSRQRSEQRRKRHSDLQELFNSKPAERMTGADLSQVERLLRRKVNLGELSDPEKRAGLLNEALSGGYQRSSA